MNDILYSPWRMEYIKSAKAEECIFCLEPDEENDKKHLVIYRSRYSFVIMNLYPYNNGHVMVVPLRHVNCLGKLSDSERNDLFALVERTLRVVKILYNPEGVNVGMNIGKAAGAGIDEHIHVHIVPRWSGDVNFMTSLGGTRVVPEDFEQAWQKLKEQFDKLDEQKKSDSGR